MCAQSEDRRPDNSCLHYADVKSRDKCRDSDFNRDTVTHLPPLCSYWFSGQEMK